MHVNVGMHVLAHMVTHVFVMAWWSGKAPELVRRTPRFVNSSRQCEWIRDLGSGSTTGPLIPKNRRGTPRSGNSEVKPRPAVWLYSQDVMFGNSEDEKMTSSQLQVCSHGREVGRGSSYRYWLDPVRSQHRYARVGVEIDRSEASVRPAPPLMVFRCVPP